MYPLQRTEVLYNGEYVSAVDWIKLGPVFRRLLSESKLNRRIHYSWYCKFKIMHMSQAKRKMLVNFRLANQPEYLSTAFHWAFKRKNYSKMTFLIKQCGFKLDNRGFRNSFIHMAITKRSKELISFLLSMGADVNNATWNMTPLYYACKKNETEIVKLLLENGASVHVKAEGMKSYMTVARNNMEILELLARYGADLNEHNYIMRFFIKPFTADLEESMLIEYTHLVCFGLDPFHRDSYSDEDGAMAMAIQGDFIKLRWTVKNLFCDPNYKVKLMEVLIATLLSLGGIDGYIIIAWEDAINLRQTHAIHHPRFPGEPESISQIVPFLEGMRFGDDRRVGLHLMKRHFGDTHPNTLRYIANHNFPLEDYWNSFISISNVVGEINKIQGATSLKNVYSFLCSYARTLDILTVSILDSMPQQFHVDQSVGIICLRNLLQIWCLMTQHLNTVLASVLRFVRNDFSNIWESILKNEYYFRSGAMEAVSAYMKHKQSFPCEMQRECDMCIVETFKAPILFFKLPFWLHPIDEPWHGDSAVEVVKSLLELTGINWNRLVHFYDKNPYLYAVRDGNSDLIFHMLEKGIDTDCGTQIRRMLQMYDYNFQKDVLDKIVKAIPFPSLQSLAARACSKEQAERYINSNCPTYFKAMLFHHKPELKLNCMVTSYKCLFNDNNSSFSKYLG